MKKIFITGSTGFVGHALIRLLDGQAYTVTAAVRQYSEALPKSVGQFFIGDIQKNTDWSESLSEVDVVIHLAARVHVMKDDSANPLEAFRLTNTTATLNLARQAAAAGVKRFIFLSSIKVNGEFSPKGRPFTPDDKCIPSDPYGLSKYEAEQGLLEIADETGMEVVIIRPPLVYGAGVKGNFQQMISWVSKGAPLPLGAINNQRSLVALDNLNDLITTCIDHPAAANEVFLVSDGEDISTTQLLSRIGGVLGVPARLLAIPEHLLIKVFSLLGKQAIAQRLCSSLQVDISKTRTLLGWQPVISVNEALTETVKDLSVSGSFMIRFFDIVFSALGLFFGFPVLVLLTLVGWFDTGSPLFRQQRVGRQQKPFTLVKFRTMKTGTASVATHLADVSAVTPFGHFLRRTKLDELPQLWNVLKGEMSLVGPRPCLPVQSELIQARNDLSVFNSRPGITGLAQIQGIDMSVPQQLAQIDSEMIRTLSIKHYFSLIIKTVLGGGSGDQVRK